MAKAQPSDSGLQELKTELKQKKLGRLYFFHGEETFLLNHYLTQMRKLALDPLTESFNYHRLTQETFDMQSFADSVENLPMMAEHTLVQVDDVDPFKLPESDRNKLQRFSATCRTIARWCSPISQPPGNRTSG